MNAYALIILITLLGEFALNTIADILNLRTLHEELPEEFADTFSDATYHKSQGYTAARIRFGMVSSASGLVVTLVFWFAGGFEFLDELVRTWQLGAIRTGIVYIGILVLLRGIFSLPFSIYSTFVIEKRFGFNTTTPMTFILDLLKEIFLGAVLGIPVLLLVLWLFQTAGGMAWVYCWIAATAFVLVIQFIAPAWIMPLFNKFTPLEQGELRAAILGFAESVKFPVRDVYVMDGSKRSTKSNAFFTGFGRNKRIALFDTLLKNHTTQELVSVLAHEIGHYKKNHILQGIIIAILQTGLMLFLLSRFVSVKGLFDAFYMEHISVYGGILFFGMLFGAIEFFLSLLLHALSRKNEFAADRFAAERTQNPGALIAALKRISSDNLSHLTPHPFYVKMKYSHPPVIDRIHALQKFQ